MITHARTDRRTGEPRCPRRRPVAEVQPSTAGARTRTQSPTHSMPGTPARRANTGSSGHGTTGSTPPIRAANTPSGRHQLQPGLDQRPFSMIPKRRFRHAGLCSHDHAEPTGCSKPRSTGASSRRRHRPRKTWLFRRPDWHGQPGRPPDGDGPPLRLVRRGPCPLPLSVS